MRDQHRLRRPEMRERRHQRVARRGRLRRERFDHGGDGALQQRNPATQIEPEIERDLFVARPAGVQAAAGVADALDQLPLDEAVHVLVGAVDERRVRARLVENARPASASICRASSGAQGRRPSAARVPRRCSR